MSTNSKGGEKRLSDQIKRIILINQKLKNLIINEYVPLAEEFFTENHFNFAGESSDSNYLDKLEKDLKEWRKDLNIM